MHLQEPFLSASSLVQSREVRKPVPNVYYQAVSNRLCERDRGFSDLPVVPDLRHRYGFYPGNGQFHQELTRSQSRYYTESENQICLGQRGNDFRCEWFGQSYGELWNCCSPLPLERSSFVADHNNEGIYVNIFIYCALNVHC